MTRQPTPKPGMERGAKAYVIALLIVGVGLVGARMGGGAPVMIAGLVVAGVCLIVGTYWLIADRLKQRR